jgi:hypothetical protein
MLWHVSFFPVGSGPSSRTALLTDLLLLPKYTRSNVIRPRAVSEEWRYLISREPLIFYSGLVRNCLRCSGRVLRNRCSSLSTRTPACGLGRAHDELNKTKKTPRQHGGAQQHVNQRGSSGRGLRGHTRKANGRENRRQRRV